LETNENDLDVTSQKTIIINMTQGLKSEESRSRENFKIEEEIIKAPIL
jgi:hypothetical protein